MSILSVESVSIRFGGLTAVNEVTCTVLQGQIYSVIGPNGAGKTTLFNCITGVYHPTEGKVLFFGKEVRRLLNRKALSSIALTGLGLGMGLFLAINIEALWDEVITSKYQYLQTFDWSQIFTSFASFVGQLSPLAFWGPVIGGFIVGCLGATSIFHSSKRTPDLINRSGIARTFQNIRLFPQMTSLENVLVGQDAKRGEHFWSCALRLPGFRRREAAAKAKAMATLQFVGLESEFNELADNLSYGQKRRLEIARALMSDPKLLLLDEPAAGMNPTESQDLMSLIRKIRDRGISVLLIEHHMRVVMGVSDYITVLNYGKKIAEGTPAEVQQNPEVIAAYLGSEEHA